ncbi:tudor domain-containing protein 1 isoform X2 [Trichomycterus rosablanca]|uniref:tudor domain-containing protein 1 isoform X2 n=1 Tax=Trichomycterus rosablanca TaxID=2290929 RepID=UPI002F35E4CA
MNSAFSASQVRPNLPLRRPATGPGLVTPSNQIPVFNNHGTSQERSLMIGSLDAFKAEAGRNENDLVAAMENGGRASLMSPASLTVKLCNYCSKQGNLRCTRCKKTCYCSVACQTEDWKAHRHICKPCAPENIINNKPKESTLPCDNESTVSEPKPRRIFLGDLHKHNISKEDKLQGSVVELKNPGKFFIQLQTVENTENLKHITMELQKCYSSLYAVEYKPEMGEICAVKFSLDQNWYRGKVEAVNLDLHTANILYIDYGNEEVVALNQLHPLAENINPAPPCALQCSVAGVTAVTSSWTGECCIAVRQLVAGKNLTFTVLDFLNDDTVLAVDAPLTLGKNLSTFLIDQGYAMQDVIPASPQTKPDINSLMNASFENFKCLSGGKIENIEAQPPEPLSQRVGDTFTAIVTHLQSPSEIICQKLENASIIQQLQNRLRDHCTKTQASENFRPAPGTVCCALFSEDNQWYRAKILAYSSKTHVCVGYIDFGNSEEVMLSHLRPLSVELLSLATQAIPCALADIKPTTDGWSEDVVMVLKQLICNRFIRVEILGARGGMALISMVDESSDPQTNVSDLLVASGYAAVGEVEIEEEEAPQSADKLEWTCAELPTDGQKVVLVVSVLENPGEFYCYNYIAEDIQALAELSSALAKHCATEGAPFSPAVGEPCCALYSDGSWYRGIVESVEDNGNAKVYFGDFGNTSEIEASDLRAINSSLLKLPFQAIRCWLAGIEPLGETWSKDAVCKFQSLCVGRQLSGRVLSITERGYGVELESNGHNMATMLISEHLAKPLGQVNVPATQTAGTTELVVTPPGYTCVPAIDSSLTEQPPNSNGQSPASPQANLSTSSFTLDWKSVELPCNETFQPQVAAATSPSLFYVMNPKKDTEGLQTVMNEVASYCSRQTVLNMSIPSPGAACCAQFSGDKNWYRAVVLDTTSTHASVIYADYGNVERVPFSSLLPIPKELLQHPFHIARCALSGKEYFPTVWPPEILELFSVQLSGKLLASVQVFDGTFNLLNVTQHLGQGGCNISSIIMEALQIGPNRSSMEMMTLNTQALAQGTTQAGGTDTGHNLPADTQKPEPQHQDTAPTSCCCAVLEQKITKIEELVLLLIKQIGATQK